MRLSEPTLKALRDTITGDGGISPYKSGPELLEFFNQFFSADSQHTYGQGFPSRWKYAETRIKDLNGTEDLRQIFKSYLDPRNFFDAAEDLESIVDYLNRYLVYDGLFLKMVSGFYEIVQKEEVSDKLERNKNLQKDANVFIVHGHDEAMKESVARFVERLGLNPVILHEQIDKGSNTIIEKFEENVSKVDFALVLLSPDDRAFALKDPKIISYRARQNVILELGYMMGKLGRDKVMALHKPHSTENIELPSDYSGVIFTLYDSNGGWKSKMIQNFKETGFEIDLHKAFY